VLTLILADSELELVPEEVKTHPSVQASAQRRGKRAGRSLLDSSAHHGAMRQLPEGDRRGRPDIVHTTLLVAMDSVLNLEGGLRLLVHTRHDEVITIAPETRVMRSFDRFCGLMEQLFRDGKAGPEGMAPLLTLEPGVTLAQAVQRAGAERTLALDPAGQAVRLAEALPKLAAQHAHVACIVGGFPRGGYRSPVKDIAQEVWRIHDKDLSAWVAAMELIVNWENATR
jgi:rRNA small subunit pseudouridine methyltransferase Nep1